MRSKARPPGAWVLVAWALLLPAPAGAQAPEAPWAVRFQACDAEIESWRPTGAACIDALAREEIPADLVTFLRAKRAFYVGESADARAALETLTGEAASANARALRALIERMEGTLRGYQSRPLRRGEGSRLRWRSPADEVFVHLLPSAWAEARREVAAWLGDALPAPSEIVIASDGADLAALAGAARGDEPGAVRVGATRYNRLFLLSPAAARDQGAWTENLRHEVAHHALVVRYGPDLPPWLAEGVACALDGRWTHPSGRRWALPSQARARRVLRSAPARAADPEAGPADGVVVGALVVRGFLRRGGVEALRRALEDPEARAPERMEPLLDQEWRRERRAPTFSARPPARESVDPEVARWHGLAGLLLARGRVGAALVELDKVWSREPGLEAGLALLPVAAAAGDWARVARVCDLLPEADAEGFVFRLSCGQGLLARQQYAEAAHALSRALAFRPYSVDAHRALAAALEGVGDTRGRLEQGLVLRLLGAEEVPP